MNRYLFAAVAVLSATSFAHDHHGVGLHFGRLDIGFHIHKHPRAVPVPQVYATPAPAPVYAQAPVYAPAPQVVYVPMPVPMAAPVMPIPMTQQVERVKPARATETTAILGIKYLAGVSVPVPQSGTQPFAQGFPGLTHTIGLEIRPNNWFSVRSDLEIRPTGGSWDLVGAKVSLPTRVFRPFASVSFTGAIDQSTPERVAFGVTAAAGLDVFFGKRFFIEAEARYRVLPSGCCEIPGVVSGSVGAGIALF